MKTLIVIAAFLGVLLTSSLANDNINIINRGNVGGDDHQTVNIDNHNNIANINNYNGWHSWDSIWDYNRGLFATRLFARRACVVSRMNKAMVPNLAQLSKTTQEKAPNNVFPPHELQYTVSPNRVKNVAQLGEHIETMCKGVPTYYAQEVQGVNMFLDTGSCTSLNILKILGISLCGHITSCFA